MIVPFGCQRCGGACLSQPTFQGKTLEELWRDQPKAMRDFIEGSEHCWLQFLKEPLAGYLKDFEELGTTVA